MLYKTLYKKNANKNISVWNIHYDNTSYWTEYGTLDGNLITTKPTIVIGKNIGKSNETSIEEQVIKKIDSIIKGKIKKELYKENIEDVDEVDLLPPMLANKYETYSDDMEFIQPKLDGVRCLFRVDTNYSRKFSVFNTVGHIENELNEVLKKYPTITFDGELYSHRLSTNFNKIVSLVKIKDPTIGDLSEIEENIEYHIYDMFDSENPDMLFSERIDFIFNNIRNMKFVKAVKTERIFNTQDVNNWFKYFTKNGYEGAIVRKNGKYEHKRSSNLLKKKEFIDNEYIINDIVCGVGNRADIAGFAILKDNKSKQTFKAGITGDFEYCKTLLENKDSVIGKLGTIKFFALTPLVTLDNGETKGGVPRFGTLLSIRDYED